MPGDIFYCRPGTFRDRDEFHSRTCKIEQRQILLQNKQNKLMLIGIGQEWAEQREQMLGNAGLSTLNDRGGDADMHREYDGQSAPGSQVGVLPWRTSSPVAA